MTSLEFAINMVLEGEMYYKELALLNKGNVLEVIFNLLAQDEAHHAQVLRHKFNKQEYHLQSNSAIKETDNIFSGLKDFLVKLSDESKKQLAVYDEALKREKESIELYRKFLAEATNKEDSELFEQLIVQEKEHYDIFDNILTLLNRPHDWVESAEFGIREEY
ncbi:MAG: ferritin family protein [Erysipelotrichaceae bacterium]|nr:ferritin family protein [Erysipelotrichaceae bacterium]